MILITGASGNVGSEVLKQAAVAKLKIRAAYLSADKVTYVHLQDFYAGSRYGLTHGPEDPPAASREKIRDGGPDAA